MQRLDAWMMGGGLPAPVRFLSENDFLNPEQLYAELKSTSGDVAAAYQHVVWAYRCANLRAMTLGGLPYRILDKNEQEVDWPLADSLVGLLPRIEFGLCLWGASYLLKLLKGRNLLGLQWLNPKTIEAQTRPREGLVGFEQRIGSERQTYEPNEIIYHTLFDPSDDLGQGISPMDAALSAAGIGRNANTFIERFFENGAIPGVVLTTDQMISEPDALSVREWWRRTFGGVKNAWKTGILQKGLKPATIGSQLKDLAIKPVYENVRSQICVAFGVPQTMLEDAANFATAKEHRLSFYYETIFPEARFIQRGFNAQLFAPMGLRFEFAFQDVEAIQQDETSKAAGLVALFQAELISRDEARQALGYEVIEEAASEVPTENTEPEQLPETISTAAYQDLARWRKKAARGAIDFESDTIPAWLQAAIRVRFNRPELADHAIDPALRMYERGPAETKLKKRVLQELLEDLDDITDAVLGGVMPEAQLAATGNRLTSALGTILLTVAVDMILSLATTTGVGVDYDQTMNDAGIWASQYSYELVRGITDSSREALQRIISKLADDQLTPEDAISQITPLFGPLRAESIATTEVTRAMSHATDQYKDDLRERGMKVVVRWLTAEDERVCDICGPLDHKTEEVWRAEFPDGPPAHPRCRCMTNLEAVRA